MFRIVKFGIPILFGMLLNSTLSAREYYVGGPVHINDLEIVANYLVGIEMAPMTPDMVHGPDVIHLEADIHATADNSNGFPEGAWIPYLTVTYTLEKQGSGWRSQGTLKTMVAKDGPHYANDIKMDGPGTYKLTYQIGSPGENGMFRHVDSETGVPEWWKPFETHFEFNYPVQ